MNKVARLMPALALAAVGLLLPGDARAVTVKGFVRRAVNNNPVASVDLDVFDAATGAFVFIINDRTGSDGLYQIVLNPGTYNITWTPPAATRLAGFRKAALVVSGAQSTVMALPDVLLEPGLQVTGHVADTSVPPNPAPNVEVRFYDAATGLSVFAAANVTNASGNFSVLVPARTYDLIYAPAAGDTLLPLRLPGIAVSADVTLAAAGLLRGVLIEGDVRGPASSPVVAADADVSDAFTGDQVITVHDDTDATGHFRFAVPAGIFDIDFFQPAGSTLAARRVEGIVVGGPTVIPAVTLPQGVTVSGRVVDAAAAAVGGVDLNLIDRDTGKVYPTARDDTDAAGAFGVNVPPGLYDIRFTPSSAGPPAVLAAAIRVKVRIAGNTALGDVALPAGRVVTGRILDADDPSGMPTPASGCGFVIFDDVSGDGFPGVGGASALDGSFALMLPPGRWVLEVLPPRGSPLLARKLPAVDLTAGGSSAGDVLLNRGVSLTGRVLGPSGAVRDVDLDVLDAAGARLITPRDDTDPLGFYSVVVPDAATYSLRYEPPRSSDLVAAAFAGVVVSGPTARPDVTLPRGVVVTGRVIDPPATPVFDVSLNVIDPLGGSYLTPHDNTISDGTFKVVLPPGGEASATVHLSPPRGSRLLFRSIAPLDLSVDVNLGDIALASGFLVSGHVTRPAGTGVRDVDLTVFDTVTGLSIRTPHDNTDGNGDYVIAAPAGTYNINFVPPPPAGERLVPGRVTLLAVAADVTGADVALQNGVWVRGRVARPNQSPVAGADLDFIHPGGAIQFTPQDRTDLNGVFSLVVPPDSYAITVEPPALTRLIGARREGVSLLSDDLSVPPFTLYDGYFLEGLVTEANGNPVSGVDLDVVDPVSGAALFTPADNTDASGFFHLIVPPGVWDLVFNPPLNSSFPALRCDGVAVRGDTGLSTTVFQAGFRIEGKVFDPVGAPVAGAEAVFLMNATTWPAPGNVADFSGRFRALVPAGVYDIVLTPPAGSGLAPLTRPGVAINGDVVLPDSHLGAAQSATLAGISPVTGTAAGGGTATLSGSGFAPGARVLMGGVAAQVTSLTSGSIGVVLPPHPPGPVDVTVVNPGITAAGLTGGFEYLRRAADIDLTVTRAGDDLVLTWRPTGQGTYTLFRAGAAAGTRSPLVIGTTGSFTLTIIGGAHPLAEGFYDVE